MTTSTLTMHFEDVLASVGDYGRYQKRLIVFFLIPVSILNPIILLHLIFSLSTPDHWCLQPQLEEVNLTSSQRLLLSRPPEDSKCATYDHNYTDLLQLIHLYHGNVSTLVSENAFNWTRKKCSGGWEYDHSEFQQTASSKWNLVCSDNYLPSLVFTMVRVGSTIGTPILSTITERIGRKPMFFILCLIGLVSGVASALIPWFFCFLALRTIFGTISPLLFQNSYILLTELVSPQLRTRINGIVCIFWTLGMAALPLVAYLCADWSMYTIVCSAFFLIYFTYFRMIPESPRWLISKGRLEEAQHILLNIAASNNKNTRVELTALKKLRNEEGDSDKQATPLDIFRCRRLRTFFLLICLIWSADLVAYEGFHINISHLYGNQFVNFLLMAVVEIPSYFLAWFLIETRLGRRLTNVCFLTFSALACYLPILFSEFAMVTTISSLLGKFGCAASFMIIYQQAAELFPTPVRTSGMGIGGTICCCISIATPYIVYTGVYNKHIPFSIIGSLNLLAAIAGMFLPETLNADLPQTMEDADVFGCDKRFFSLADTRPKLQKKADDGEEMNSLKIDDS